MGEQERGCGWRVVGGIYLVCDGAGDSCDALPLELKTCPCCDFEVKNSRSMQAVHMGYLAGLVRGHVCGEKFEGCPICEGTDIYDMVKFDKKLVEFMGVESFYLMNVSKDLYTPESFMDEAVAMGISKRISPNSLPKKFKVGRDWVFLLHCEVPFYGETNGDIGAMKTEPVKKRAIFYAFKPERLEIVLWKGTDPQTILDYEQAGYSVVLLDKTPENLARHSETKLPPLPYWLQRKKKAEGVGQ